MSIGIYKITNPSGKIYIGQSTNIVYRFKAYKRLSCKSQIKLYNSFLKYGVKNHIFEIIEECKFEELNIRERYWQDYYNVLESGLNCILTDTDKLPKRCSNETKLKKSITMKNIFKNKPKISKPIYQYDLKGNLIRKWEDIKDVGLGIGYLKKNANGKILTAYNNIWSWELKKFSEGFIDKIPPPFYERIKGHTYNNGRKHTEESNNLKSNKLKGRIRTKKEIENIIKGKSIPIIQYDLDGNFIKEWTSIKEAGEILNFWPQNISSCCKGKIKQSYGFKWKYKQ